MIAPTGSPSPELPMRQETSLGKPQSCYMHLLLHLHQWGTVVLAPSVLPATQIIATCPADMSSDAAAEHSNPTHQGQASSDPTIVVVPNPSVIFAACCSCQRHLGRELPPARAKYIAGTHISLFFHSFILKTPKYFNHPTQCF